MFKKSLAIILSIALAVGILVQGSFAFNTMPPKDTFDNVVSSAIHGPTSYVKIDYVHDSLLSGTYKNVYVCESLQGWEVYIWIAKGNMLVYNDKFYSDNPDELFQYCSFSIWSVGLSWSNSYVLPYSVIELDGVTYYEIGMSESQVQFNSSSFNFYSSSDILIEGVFHSANLDISDYIPDLRFLDAYMTMSTYGNVKYLCVESDDIVLSSTWVSVRYTDQFGPGTFILDYPFDFFTSNGHSFIKIMPDFISPYEFTVTSVLYSGSSSWGVKELTGLSLTFNEDLFPTPIPSAYPVPDYSYYDTTYINYNGGNPEIIYTPISSQLTIGFLGSDTSKFYFLDEFPFLYLEQPFSYSFIVIPDIQFEYSSFLGDCIYQYDVVIDDFEITNDNYSQTYSFDYIYGSGAWSNLNGLLTAAQVSDVSSILEYWYASHAPIVYQFPYHTNEAFSFDDRVFDCSLIITDSFFFKQTNYLLGDTGDILSEFSERFFKIDGFSDSLFDNISSLYNLNLQYYDSSLEALTGLSYWLNDNDISNNLSDITNLLSSLDSYLSSVDGKLNYLVTIDSDLNDLLEWFQNQEDSDVTLTLPDFNPSILIEVYGQNIGDLVGFFQDFIYVLPDFDFSDFPNFFDYAADLVDDVAGQDDDLINDLYQPYDYSDSGLHEFGWD